MLYTIVATIYFALSANALRKRVFSDGPESTGQATVFFLFFFIMSAAGITQIAAQMYPP